MGGFGGATPVRSGVLLVGAWLAGGLVFVLAVAAAGLLARASTDAGVHSLDPSDSVTAFGTLIIEDAQYVQYQPNEVRDCAGSGDFADVFQGAAIEVRAGGAPVATGTLARGAIRPIATVRLADGHGIGHDLCSLMFFFTNFIPYTATRVELSIAGHGTAVVTGFTLPLILLLDASGELAACDDTSTIQCGP